VVGFGWFFFFFGCLSPYVWVVVLVFEVVVRGVGFSLFGVFFVGCLVGVFCFFWVWVFFGGVLVVGWVCFWVGGFFLCLGGFFFFLGGLFFVIGVLLVFLCVWGVFCGFSLLF